MTLIKVNSEKNAVISPSPKARVIDNIRDRPFKCALALFAVYTGISGLFVFGTSNEIFAMEVEYSAIFNYIFILAGLGTFFGVVRQKANVEAAGLLLISASLLLRMAITLIFVGWNPMAHNFLAISLLFTSASIIRILDIAAINKVMEEGEKTAK